MSHLIIGVDSSKKSLSIANSQIPEAYLSLLVMGQILKILEKIEKLPPKLAEYTDIHQYNISNTTKSSPLSPV